MIQQYVYDYIRSLGVIEELDDIDFSDKAFAYDYNEVQELFFDEEENNYVLLAGKTGLRKKDMIGRIFKDLQLRGVSNEDVLYLDYERPLIRDAEPSEIVSKFVKERAESESLYLIINEIQEIDNWFEFLSGIRNEHGNVKVLASSSTPPYIYEKMYDTSCPYCKIVVLSEKNDSNIKYETMTFGVFNEFKYNVKNGVVEIKGLTIEGKKMPFHRIPSEIDGYPVKIIASGAFHDRKEIEDIEIPESISMIGDYAFSKCSGLKHISLPADLRYIGDHAFLGASQLSVINGGENVEHIGNSAFYGTKWVDIQGDFAIIGKVLYKYKGPGCKVDVPTGLKTLAPYSFSDTDVTDVKLPETIKLEEGVFYNCSKLENINLELDKIPAFTFYGCEKLRYAGHISVAGKFSFYSCDSLVDVNVEVADVCSFACCGSLKSVDFLKKADKGAFWDCGHLSQINFSEVELIGDCSFGRTGIMEIETAAKTIGNYAFMDCTSLTKVSLKDNPTVGRNSLFGCKSVSEMSVSGKDKIMWYFGKHPDNLVKLTVTGDICDDYCRNCQSLEDLTLRNVERFGRWCFYNNDSLSNVRIENVKTIGDWSFAYCDSISEIILPDTVSYIGMNAFRYCNGLKTITMESDKPVEFGANAFYSTHPSKVFYVYEDLIDQYSGMKIWGEYLSAIKSMKRKPITSNGGKNAMKSR